MNYEIIHVNRFSLIGYCRLNMIIQMLTNNVLFYGKMISFTIVPFIFTCSVMIFYGSFSEHNAVVTMQSRKRLSTKSSFFPLSSLNNLTNCDGVYYIHFAIVDFRCKIVVDKNLDYFQFSGVMQPAIG